MCIRCVCDAIAILYLTTYSREENRQLEELGLYNSKVFANRPGLQILHFSAACHHDASFCAIVLFNSIYFLETYHDSVDRSRQLLRTHVAKF